MMRNNDADDMRSCLNYPCSIGVCLIIYFVFASLSLRLWLKYVLGVSINLNLSWK